MRLFQNLPYCSIKSVDIDLNRNNFVLNIKEQYSLDNIYQRLQGYRQIYDDAKGMELPFTFEIEKTEQSTSIRVSGDVDMALRVLYELSCISLAQNVNLRTQLCLSNVSSLNMK